MMGAVLQAARPMIADRGMGEPISLAAVLLAGKKVAPDAILLLMQDHLEAMAFFDMHRERGDPDAKAEIARKLCAALRAHMEVEEEIFYPAAREATGDDALLDHAIEEHRQARELVEQIEAAGSAAEDGLVERLRAAIEEHVAEEEGRLFPELRGTELDFYALGRLVAARRVELLFRLTGRATDTDLQETYMTPIDKDEARSLFLAGLRDAHAAARQCRAMTERQVERYESYPKVRDRLSAHLAEKDDQLERLETVLEQLGSDRSMLKDAAMAMAGNMSAMMTAVAEDEILKNSLVGFGQANFEAASYEALIVLGEAAGETEAIRTLQRSLSEERAMAAWLAENLRGVTMMHLQRRTEGLPASR